MVEQIHANLFAVKRDLLIFPSFKVGNLIFASKAELMDANVCIFLEAMTDISLGFIAQDIACIIHNSHRNLKGFPFVHCLGFELNAHLELRNVQKGPNIASVALSFFLSWVLSSVEDDASLIIF